MTPGEQLSATAERVIRAGERFKAALRAVWGRPNLHRNRDGTPDDPTPEQDARSRNRTLAARFNGRHFGD